MQWVLSQIEDLKNTGLVELSASKLCLGRKLTQRSRMFLAMTAGLTQITLKAIESSNQYRQALRAKAKEVLSIGLSKPETVLVLAGWLRTYLDTEVAESLPALYKHVVLAEPEQIDWCSLAEEFIDNVSSDTHCGVTVVDET